MKKDRVKESEEESVDFNEIVSLFEDKREKIKEKEKEIFILIKNKIPVMIGELNEKVKILEGIDMELIKAEERVKVIVKGNLNNYIKCTKKITEDLSNLREDDLEKFIDRLNNIFLDFDRKSHINYQKANFLIGNEIVAVKERVINFSKYLGKLFNKNKEILDSSKIISFIHLNLKELDGIKKDIKEIDEKNKSLDEKIKNNEKIMKKIKKNDIYIENLKKQEEIKSTEKALEDDIYKLKQLIDLKSLANVFHNNEKEWNLIKAYKKDFQTALKKDNGASILNLLEGAKLNNDIISAKIKQINDKKEEIIKDIKTIERDEIEELLTKIRNTELEIGNLNNEKINELKKYDKLKLNKENIMESVKQGWGKLGISNKF